MNKKDRQDMIDSFASLIDSIFTDENKNKSNQETINNKEFVIMVDNNMKLLKDVEDKDIDAYSSIVSVIIENAKIIDAEKLKGVDLENIFEFFTIIDYSINMLLAKLKTQFIKAYNESR